MSGNKPSKEDIINTNLTRIKANSKKVKVLVIGQPGRGKSELLNSIYRVVTGKTGQPREVSKVDKGTWNFKSLSPDVSNLTNITFFDCPGFSPQPTKESKEIVELLLKGLTDGFLIDQFTADTLKTGSDPKNACDICIIVVSLKSLQQKSGLFSYALNSIETMYFDTLVSTVQKITGRLPFLVLTHKEDSGLSLESIHSHFATVVRIPTGNIFLLENYDSAKSQSSLLDTDLCISRLLVDLLLRLDATI